MLRPQVENSHGYFISSMRQDHVNLTGERREKYI